MSEFFSDISVSEWINLFVRWIHIFAGILWVGTTYYFTWLDLQFAKQEKSGADNPQVWMVHSGGFYVVNKQKAPDLGRELHWFRYEAAFTWLSGLVLLVVVYYLGTNMMVEPGSKIPTGMAHGIGFMSLILGWTIYDLLMISPLGKNDVAAGCVLFALLAAAAYGLCHTLTARAAYIHIGAMLGTIMTANVWMRILPAQRRMIAAVREGRQPDAALGARAKLRSKQNTFMVVPVVFLMISNHFPSTYGSPYNWIILCVMVLLGWGAAKWMRRV
jgi:uncharacterized membrane protein